MKQLTLLVFILLIFNKMSFSQVKDTVYFNSKWEKTTKNKASFYRNIPLEQKEDLVLIKNYYISGSIQFIGWAKQRDTNIFEGEVKWFYDNGNLSKVANYIVDNVIVNGALDGDYKEYYENGTLKIEEVYLFGSRKKGRYYDVNGKLIGSCTYKNNDPFEGKTNCFTVYEGGRLLERKLYYEDTKGLAFEGYYRANNKYYKDETYYKKNGEVLKNLKGVGTNLSIKFHSSKKCGYVIGIKLIKEGSKYLSPADKEYYYNKKGELSAEGINKYGKPFNGTFYDDPFAFYEITSRKIEDESYYLSHYKEGELINIKEFLNEKLFANGDFLNNEPYNGTFVNKKLLNKNSYTAVYTLKNGLKEGKMSYYISIADISIDRTIAFYNYKNGKKEGESSIYDGYDNKHYKMLYKNDMPYEGFLKNEDSNLLQYKNGHVVGERKNAYYKDYHYYEIYKKGIKTSIEYGFLDHENKKIEPGIFRNGKPYSGYFFNTKLKEIVLDYYKAGIKQPNQSKKFKEIIYEETILGSE